LDLVLTIVFYAFAILAVVGALTAALSAIASRRLLGLIGVAVGTAGVLLSFSAWLVAPLALACLGASALLVGGGGQDRGTASARPAGLGEAGPVTLAGVAATASLFVLLVAAAAGGSFQNAGSGSAGVAASALGRVFFARDALAVDAVGAAVMIALAVGALARGRRS